MAGAKPARKTMTLGRWIDLLLNFISSALDLVFETPIRALI
jgi:hypothetical protein